MTIVPQKSAVLGLAFLLVLVALATPATAESGPQFLEQRPIEIAVESIDYGVTRWRVAVVNGAPSPGPMTLMVAFDPAGVVSVAEPSRQVVDAGGVASFFIELKGRQRGSGQLVLIGRDGAISRRELRVFSQATLEKATVPTELNLSGWHLAPLTSRVELASVAVGSPNNPNLAQGLLGFVSSDSGGLYQVIRSGSLVSVQDVEGAGKYVGSIELTPGTKTKVTVSVRDTPAWPLLVLAFGLVLVSRLDIFRKRSRPRRALLVRLAWLRRRAATEQQRTLARLRQVPRWTVHGIDRVVAEPGDPELLLEIESAAAVRAWDLALEQADRDRWAPGGAGLSRLEGLVDSFAVLVQRERAIANEWCELLELESSLGRAELEFSAAAALVRDAITPQAILEEDTLARRQAEVERAVKWLERFRHNYEALTSFLGVDDSTLQAEAESALGALLRADENLDAIEGRIAELRQRIPEPPRGEDPTGTVEQEAVTRGAYSGRPVEFPSGPPTVDLPTGQAHREEPRAVRRRSVRIASAAAVVIPLLVITTASLILSRSGKETPPPSTTTSLTTSPPPSTTSTVPSTTTVPAAPVDPKAPIQPSPSGPYGYAGGGGSPLGRHWIDTVIGVALPVLLLPAGLAILVLVCALLLARLLRRSEEGSRMRASATRETEADYLMKDLRRTEARFLVLSGALVILTGMSVLYFPNPTFGTPADYLGVFLWGSAVGEGVQLARRLVPNLPSQ